MSTYIVKLEDKGVSYYLEWSTIADAPITNGMSLEEFKQYYQDTYGQEKMSELNERLARVEEKCISAFNYDNLSELLECNRAGEGESCLSIQELIQKYCTTKTKNI